MDVEDWGFLLDENVERAVGEYLRENGYRAEHVVSTLKPGADDLTDVLPYARAEDLIGVTKDVSDFSALGRADHEGILLIVNHRLTVTETGSAILRIVEAYPSRDELRNHIEFLDGWVQ